MVEAIREGDIPGVRLRQRRRLPAAADTLWEWCRLSGRLAGWLADEVELEDGVGGELRLESRAFEGSPLLERGRTLHLDERRWELHFRRLDAGWDADTRLVLEAIEHGRRDSELRSELVVTQGGFQRLPLSICLTEWELYRRRWRAALDRLERRLGGAAPSA